VFFSLIAISPDSIERAIARKENSETSGKNKAINLDHSMIIHSHLF
jgi:hypothetical protein